MRPVYWVARGVPVVIDGVSITNYPLHTGAFYDSDAAVDLCKETASPLPRRDRGRRAAGLAMKTMAVLIPHLAVEIGDEEQHGRTLVLHAVTESQPGTIRELYRREPARARHVSWERSLVNMTRKLDWEERTFILLAGRTPRHGADRGETAAAESQAIYPKVDAPCSDQR
jgi:hypothetical protein